MFPVTSTGADPATAVAGALAGNSGAAIAPDGSAAVTDPNAVDPNAVVNPEEELAKITGVDPAVLAQTDPSALEDLLTPFLMGMGSAGAIALANYVRTRKAAGTPLEDAARLLGTLGDVPPGAAGDGSTTPGAGAGTSVAPESRAVVPVGPAAVDGGTLTPMHPGAVAGLPAPATVADAVAARNLAGRTGGPALNDFSGGQPESRVNRGARQAVNSRTHHTSNEVAGLLTDSYDDIPKPVMDQIRSTADALVARRMEGRRAKQATQASNARNTRRVAGKPTALPNRASIINELVARVRANPNIRSVVSNIP